jgi:hypothetical protein
MAMKYRIGTLVVLANLAVLLGIAVAMPELMVSPGKVMDGHAGIAGDCFACHTPFMGSAPQKCVACHKVDQIGLLTTSAVPIAAERKNIAFHRQLRDNDCVACHSDHRGVQAFRPIGQFSHELLVSDLSGQCATCHTRPHDPLHRRIDGRCGTCHTQTAWKPATFDHDRYFVLDRAHDAACATCHVNDDYAAYTCYGCHAHSRAGVRTEHLEEGIYDFQDCVACHRSGNEHEAEYRMRFRADPRSYDNLRGYRGGYERGGDYEDDD